MKKLLLLLTTGALALNAGAQVQPKSAVFNQGRVGTQISEPFTFSGNFRSATRPDAAKSKSTAPMSRWYVPFDMLDFILYGGNLAANGNITPIWFDSTVRQRFSTGLGTINFSSVAQISDVISNNKLFNDPLAYPTEMAITVNNAYTVDSVRIAGTYQRLKPGITDTLIISVGVSKRTYYWRKSDPDNNNSWTNAYIPSNDTLWGISPVRADSVNRAMFSDTTNPARIMWKVPLDATMGDATLTVQDFTFAVPGGLNVQPGGGRVGVTFTFKSGDQWVKNVDSFNSMNNFRAFFAEAADGGVMPYHYYDQYRDRNGSSLMFSTDTSFYAPSVAIEGWNAPSFRQEFLYAGVHARCNDCVATGVGNVNKTIGDVNAYPNPASDEVAIRFSLEAAADANVTISNTLGQVLKTQHLVNVSNGKATFSTADMANGVYFYTVESNGSRLTNRLVVAH